MKKIFAMLCVALLLLTACGRKEPTDRQPAETDKTEDTVLQAPSVEEMFTERDRRTEAASEPLEIQLKGDSVTASEGVEVSGTTVTIRKEATYRISGTLTDGRIVVDCPDTAKLQIILNGASITSETSAPLYVLEADKVFLTLAEGTENTLANGGSFVAVDENTIDGALFSKQDLTLNGSGSLTVTSPAGHGIVCKDDLVLYGGNYTVASASHGLDANDSIRMANATLKVDAGKDGMHCENSDDASLGFVYLESGRFAIEAEGDGISAGSTLQVQGGSYSLLTGGGAVNGTKQTSDQWGGFMGGRPMASVQTEESSTSIKGLKAAGDLTISGGSFEIDAADDGVHSNANVTVNGGTFKIASGDDGFHADETLTITDGTIDVTESYEGLEGLHVAVSGGEIKAVCSDDGINAAGGADASGFGGNRGNEQFGGGMHGPGGKPGGGGMGGGGMSANSDGSIKISGGKLYIQASGDGIDANGSLEISGGYTVVCGPTRGDTATLDYDVSATVSGGTFIGTGGSGMAQTFSNASQGLISVHAGNAAANTKIILKDAGGKVLLEHTPALDYAVVILTCPEMISGDSYTMYVGEQSATFTAT
ncbi:MAG: carbohydrate-binding domain-containing protein [Clostridia bacterium]|nr:carbohydrate-binding domain-containing protein [Clostridia bacterium]